MRLLLLTILFYTPQLFAEVTYSSRAHECRNDKGFQRRVELQYLSSEAPLPCRVVWFRGDVKNPEVEHVLVEAKHQAGTCEAREQGYLDKMKSWKVDCVPVDRHVAEAPSEEPKVEPPPPPPPVATSDVERSQWQGAYVGGVVGAQFGQSKNTSGSFGYNADAEAWEYSSPGFNVAGQWGYNHLWGGWVIGPEFELGYMSIKGDGVQPAAPGSDTVGEISSDLYTALRLRVGAETGRHLFFAALGVIGVSTETKVTDGCSVAPCGGTTMEASDKGFNWGYTLGVGYEHIFERRWSLKLEYMYFDLADRQWNGTTNLGDTYEWTSETTGSVLRGGVGWYF